MSESGRRRARIVVVGAGFAGASLVGALPRSLRRETLLVDRRSRFDYVPLIHEVAAGRLHPDNVRHRIPPPGTEGCGFLHANVTGLDLENKTLATDAGEVEYEHLVVATGSSASPPPEEFAGHFRRFRSVEDAVGLRDEVSRVWRNGQEITVAIAGGGTTGVELAAEIGHLMRYLKRRTARSTVARVVLLEASDTLMGWLDPYFHRVAKKSLERLGVEVRLNSPVEDADGESVRVGDSRIPADVRVWTAGHEVSGIAAKLPGERDKAGRLRVEDRLTVPNHPEVYLLGDAGVYEDPRHGPLPPTASVAVQQGPFAARDLTRRLRDAAMKRPAFDFLDRGYIVSLGPKDAAAEAFGAKFSGPAAHALYRSVLLYYLKDRGGRVLTSADWAMERIGRLGFP